MSSNLAEMGLDTHLEPMSGQYYTLYNNEPPVMHVVSVYIVTIEHAFFFFFLGSMLGPSL